MPTKKQASWCRAEVPDDLRVTFVASKSEDALLHSYLGSLRFGSASKEVRRLLSFAIRNIDVPDRPEITLTPPAESVGPGALTNRNLLATSENLVMKVVDGPTGQHSLAVTHRAAESVSQDVRGEPDQRIESLEQNLSAQEHRDMSRHSSFGQVTEEDLKAISMLDAMSGN